MADDRERTIAEILREAEAADRSLIVEEAALEAAIRSLDDIEWDRPLKAGERDRRAKLRSAQTACRAAMVELSYVTLRALDQSAEVKRLANAFTSIKSDLKKAEKHVAGVAKASEAAVKVLAGLEKVIAALAKLMV